MHYVTFKKKGAQKYPYGGKCHFHFVAVSDFSRQNLCVIVLLMQSCLFTPDNLWPDARTVMLSSCSLYLYISLYFLPTDIPNPAYSGFGPGHTGTSAAKIMTQYIGNKSLHFRRSLEPFCNYQPKSK